MQTTKKIIGFVLLGIIITLIIYICYFELIYRSDVVTYFNIDAKEVTKITIFENKIGTEALDKNTLIKYEVDSKNEVLELISKLENCKLKQKVYKQFKFNHGIPINQKNDILTDYMIMIYLPNNQYDFYISGGRFIRVNVDNKNTASKSNFIFEVIGKPFDLQITGEI
ncbi:hypothetical protein AN1V17_47550 [Vallitalea sediminicola]